MKEAVLRHKMPPWFVDPHYGTFSNANELKQSEIDTIAAWADAKASQGDPKDLPKPVDWIEGWQIGKLDLVMQLPLPFDVPLPVWWIISTSSFPQVLRMMCGYRPPKCVLPIERLFTISSRSYESRN